LSEACIISKLFNTVYVSTSSIARHIPYLEVQYAWLRNHLDNIQNKINIK